MSLSWISIDLVEYIVLLNGSYRDFKEIYNVSSSTARLNNERDRRNRIVNKLTTNKIKKNRVQGFTISKYFVDEGILHRENDLPARITIYSDGTGIFYQDWMIEGILCRFDDKPAVIDIDKTLKREYWYCNGEMHRSIETNLVTGDKYHEFWKMGKRISRVKVNDKN